MPSVVTQIASWFRRQFTGAPVIGYGPGNIGVGTREVYPDIDLNNAINIFNSNAAVYSIVSKGATKFGCIPRVLYNNETTEEKATYAPPKLFSGKNDLVTLLNRPNPMQGQDAFFGLVWCFWQVCGEAFIWLNRGDTMGVDINGELTELSDEQQRRKPVLEMYVLPADKMIIVPDPQNIWGVYGYLLESNVRIPIRAVDVIHWKKPNMRFDAVSKDHMRGMSPLKPGSVEVELYSSIIKSMLRGVQNDGSKGMAFNKLLNKMTPEQMSKMEQVIDRKTNWLDTKNAIASVQGDWGFIDFARTAVEMEVIAGTKLAWQMLCALFELPYELFDPATTFATKTEAQKGWITNTISPACKQLDGEFNRVLLPAFGLDKKAFIGSDYSDLPEMQIDLQAMATALAAAWWLSPNEKREMMMQEPRTEPEYDEIWPPSGLQPQSAVEDAAAQEAQALKLERSMGKNGN